MTKCGCDRIENASQKRAAEILSAEGVTNPWREIPVSLDRPPSSAECNSAARFDIASRIVPRRSTFSTSPTFNHTLRLRLTKKIFEQRFAFDLLNALQQGNGWLVALAQRGFARIDKCKSIPFTTANQFCLHCRFPGVVQIFDGFRRDDRTTSVFADPMKPILCVPIIRFASMHDAVQKTSIGIVNALRNGMRFVEVIMPEQDERTNQRLC